MPLYMDIHTVDSDNFSVEDVVIAHMKDLEVQEIFGVIQHKYWVNIESKMIFCLMEGPNKKACNDVHQQSHGGTACNIIEVSDSEFSHFLGVGTKNENDLAQTLTGEIDAGYRTIQLISIHDFTGNFRRHVDELYQLIKKHEGVIVPDLNEDIMVTFISASNAVLCTIAVDNLLNKISSNFEYRLALVTGNPVDEFGSDLFEETKKRIQYLSKIGSNQTIYIDEATKLVSNKEQNTPKINQDKFSIIKEANFVFLDGLFKILKDELFKSDFKSEKLYALLGLSKSQTYRKIKSLTGMAPNTLIQELRLRQSLKDIAINTKTVAEIAYDLGFNSPTYFTRVFRKRFGILPTSFAKLADK